MELKEFVKGVLIDVIDAVEEVKVESSHNMHLDSLKNQRTVEFDIAVTVEDATSATGKAGIKVFSVIEGGGEAAKEQRNTSVSRIQFGVYVDCFSKTEKARHDDELTRLNSQNEEFDPY